jgi:hypothetical protein
MFPPSKNSLNHFHILGAPSPYASEEGLAVTRRDCLGIVRIDVILSKIMEKIQKQEGDKKSIPLFHQKPQDEGSRRQKRANGAQVAKDFAGNKGLSSERTLLFVAQKRIFFHSCKVNEKGPRKGF